MFDIFQCLMCSLTGAIPENFEQTAATITNFLSLKIRVLLGTTKLIIVMQFVFPKTS